MASSWDPDAAAEKSQKAREAAKQLAFGSTAGIGTYFPADKDLALADQIAQLSPELQEKALEGFSEDSLLHDFRFWGRPSQLTALDSEKWLITLLAGRGYGKTRTLAEWVHDKAMSNPGCRIALVGRVTSDVRDVIIMGESGILAVAPPEEKPRYVATLRRVLWPNGSEAMTFSADIPDQLRGPQFHFAACDELASWRVKATGGGLTNAWDNVRIATRLGGNPQIFVATTPRRVPMIVEVMALAQEEEERVTLIRGSTFANRHLSSSYMDVVTGLYAGTHMGAQELEGELLGDIEGALLGMDVIDGARDLSDEVPPLLSLPFRVIGVDPSVAENPKDEAGIVAVGATGHKKMHERHAFVYEDASILGSPQTWAKEAVRMARKYKAVIVAEDNQGGAMVKMVIKAEDSSVPVVLVRAQHGKMLRAEPVVMAYEQGRVHHTDYFGDLEMQLTGWIPGETRKSPDRLDALVHGLTALLVKQPKSWVGEITVTSASGRTLPIGRFSGADRSGYGYQPSTPGGRRGGLATGRRTRRTMSFRKARNPFSY